VRDSQRCFRDGSADRPAGRAGQSRALLIAPGSRPEFPAGPRILYLDTCDPAQTVTTSHCQDQSSPVLIVQRMTFADGNATGQLFDGGGGGAIFDRGGQLEVVDSHFTGNRCDAKVTGRSAGAPTQPGRARRVAAAAGPSTPTETATR